MRGMPRAAVFNLLLCLLLSCKTPFWSDLTTKRCCCCLCAQLSALNAASSDRVYL
jgi:hypothetical protein